MGDSKRKRGKLVNKSGRPDRVVKAEREHDELDAAIKVAIIGTAPSTCDVYMGDDWEHWGLAYRYLDHVRDGKPYFARAFELHCMEYFTEEGRTPAFFEWIKAPPIPVYVMPTLDVEHKCEIYPVNKALELLGRPYFTNTLTWMIALAIISGAKEIAVLGADMATDSEYGDQRPNVEHVLGIAMGRGIKVRVPEQSTLLHGEFLYGLEPPPEQSDDYAKFLTERIETLEKEKEEQHIRHLMTAGALLEAKGLQHVRRIGERGATLSGLAELD